MVYQQCGGDGFGSQGTLAAMSALALPTVRFHVEQRNGSLVLHVLQCDRFDAMGRRS